MNTVKAKNVIVEVDISGTYYPFFCGKNMTFSQNQELIEITSVNSAVAREYEAGMTTANLSIDGVTILDNTGNKVAILYLMQESIRRTPQTMRIRLTDDDGGTKQIAFTALITNNTLSRSYGQYSQSSTSLTITGEPVISAIIDPPGVACPADPLYIDVVAGASSVHSALLEAAGVEILTVARTGTVHNATTGTPGNLQYLFTGGTGNGTIAFDATVPFEASEVIYILYKVT